MHANTAASESSRPTPGILILAGDFAQRATTETALDEILSAGYGFPVHSAATIRLNDWLVACVISRSNVATCSFINHQGISVLIEGNITDVMAARVDASNSMEIAERVAQLYSEFGLDCVKRLRGSFVGVIVDCKKEKAFVFNDRVGTRPLYSRTLNSHSIAFAPNTRILEKIEPKVTTVDRVAVGEFLIRGCFYGSDTLFKGIGKVSNANLFSLGRDGFSNYKYWELTYTPEAASEQQVMDQLDQALRVATRRLLATVQAPAILLSGGGDSRLMLGYLLDEGARIPSFSYAVQGSTGDDHIVASRVAAATGITHETYFIDASDFGKTAIKEALAADGRVQIIDAPSNRWEYIASQYQSMFIGDHCFGFKGHVSSAAEALDTVGWWNLDAVPRIADWIKPEVRNEMQAGISTLQEKLIQDANVSNFDDLKNKLFFYERLGNMANGFSARRLRVAEQARPFLDEEVIDCISRMPRELRIEKAIVRKLMQSRFPKLDAMPYAEKRSVPWQQDEFIRLINTQPNLRNFILEQVTIGLDPRLASIFNVTRIEDTAKCLFNGSPLPSLSTNWWVKLPGAWRFSKQSQGRVGALPGLLRLLQLNLFLTH